VLGDVALGVGLDEEVEVAGLVVSGDGGVGADDFLGGAVGLLDRGADGDVLADGEAEDRGLCGELESVAGGGLAGSVSGFWDRIASRTEGLGRLAGKFTHMATLWEMTVFSASSNSWNVSGLRTGTIPAGYSG
jgi:hypothetical protein